MAVLYGVEKEARGQSPEVRMLIRQETANPFSMIWRNGCTHSFPKYRASQAAID